MFIPEKAHKQNLTPCQKKLCAPIWNISHIITSLLQSGLKRNDQYITQNQRLVPHIFPSNRQGNEQLRQCPNVNGVSDGVGFRQTLLFLLFEGPRRAFDASRLVLDLVACFIFFFWFASTKFVRWIRYFLCCSSTRIWLHVQAWHRTDIWWSESLSRSEGRKISRNEWWLIADLPH